MRECLAGDEAHEGDTHDESTLASFSDVAALRIDQFGDSFTLSERLKAKWACRQRQFLVCVFHAYSRTSGVRSRNPVDCLQQFTNVCFQHFFQSSL